MSFDLALRLTEIMLALAFLQSSAEHLSAGKRERLLFLPRFGLSLMLLGGVYTNFICLALLIHALFILRFFQGPYNGGSDRMGLLIVCCITLVHFMPSQYWQEAAFGYLAVQLTLSYFMAGFVKVINPEWRSGRALQDVFLFSAYPASERMRRLADYPNMLRFASWAVIAFELAFPFFLVTQEALLCGLVIAALFHLANAVLFGLNRFFWVWLAAYPSIIWLQDRIF